MRTALGVMARTPSAGKTRLAPHVTSERLHTLRVALLSDTLMTAAAATDIDPFIFVSGDAAISGCLPRPMPLVEQTGDDLGQRMRAALTDLLVDRGYDAAMLIGTDIPFLSRSHISDARARLAAHDGIVLGPADDGGYYLIGMKQLHAGLFEHVAWSTERVLTDTLSAADRLGLEARLLPSLYDIDTIDDLRRAERDLEVAPSGVAPNLRAWLNTG